MRVPTLGQEDPLEEGNLYQAPAHSPVYLSGEPHGQRSLVGFSRKRWQHTYHLISINQQVYKLFTFEKNFKLF